MSGDWYGDLHPSARIYWGLATHTSPKGGRSSTNIYYVIRESLPPERRAPD